jgi:hypothetical protein
MTSGEDAGVSFTVHRRGKFARRHVTEARAAGAVAR